MAPHVFVRDFLKIRVAYTQIRIVQHPRLTKFIRILNLLLVCGSYVVYLLFGDSKVFKYLRTSFILMYFYFWEMSSA